MQKGLGVSWPRAQPSNLHAWAPGPPIQPQLLNPRPYIEGAAVDRAGNFYAVDFKRGRSNIGKIDGNDGTCSPTPAASTKDHPTITALNGLRVLPDGSMLATAPEQKQIVVIEKVGNGFRVQGSGLRG